MIINLNDTGYSYHDALERFEQAADWARNNCQSFQAYEILDVGDFSMINDVIANYRFDHEEDGIMFRLAWC